MAGKTPHEARSAFLAPLQRALSCVTNAQLVYRTGAPGKAESLRLSEEPARIPRNDNNPPWWLSVEQRYALVKTDDPERGPWKVSTRAYRYRLDNPAGEVASWHWHPLRRGGHQDPHVHVTTGPLAGLHVPTGRVSVEEVIRLLLSELEARPRRSDWQEVLDATLDAFRRWRIWA